MSELKDRFQQRNISRELKTIFLRKDPNRNLRSKKYNTKIF